MEQDPGAEPTEAPTPQADLPADHLEEVTFQPQSRQVGLEVGAVHRLGEMEFVVSQPPTWGWYPAVSGETPLLVNPGLDGSAWQSLPGHRAFARVVHAGPDGMVIVDSAGEGQPISYPLPLGQALEALSQMAKLMLVLKSQQVGLVDFDPEGLLLTANGLKFRLPPVLVTLGQPAPEVWRLGYTPPEVQAHSPVTGQEGSYLLGAWLYHLLVGEPLPAEGWQGMVTPPLAHPGIPQLLAQLLAAATERPQPNQLSSLIARLNNPPLPVLQIGADSSIGLNLTRTANEDAYGYVMRQSEDDSGTYQLLLACVADGMGGMEAGELASQAAVTAFLSASPPHPIDNPQSQAEWNLQLVHLANTAVIEGLNGLQGGCTLSSVVMRGNRYSLGHVGDTRVYLWSQGQLTQISRDHSLVAAMVASKMITPEEAEVSPDKNKILRSLGSLRQMPADYADSLQQTSQAWTGLLGAGESLVLVTDGVWGEVSHSQMASLLQARPANPQEAAEALVQAAVEAGAPDNATALIIYRSR